MTSLAPDEPTSAAKVGFLCIGAQKAGTSWLNEQLLRHASICLPPIKEVHYFNYLHSPVDRVWIVEHYLRPARVHISAMLQKAVEGIDWGLIAYYARLVDQAQKGDVDERWYAEVFSLCREMRLLRGDITPAYLPLNIEGIAHVHRYNPAMRVIALLREPVDRAVSAAKMILKRNKVAQPDDEVWRSVITGHGILQKSSYAGQLQSWLAVFPSEQLLVLPYERISTEPKALMDEVCDFLSISRMADMDIVHERIHGGRSYDVPGWVVEWFETRLADERTLVERMYPQFSQWWLK